MRTTKPISTISFNTPSFLALKLDELQKAGRISFWAFVRHKPEDDEGGKKEHMHVYVEPSKMLQTDDLRAELRQLDPDNPEKPLGTLTWYSSRFDAWYLYALHDRRYLASKGQARRYHYSAEEVIASDDQDLTFRVKSIDLLSLSPYYDMLEAIEQGVTWPEYFKRGTVPLPQIAAFERAYTLMMATSTDRNGRDGHPSDNEMREP